MNTTATNKRGINYGRQFMPIMCKIGSQHKVRFLRRSQGPESLLRLTITSSSYSCKNGVNVCRRHRCVKLAAFSYWMKSSKLNHFIMRPRGNCLHTLHVTNQLRTIHLSSRCYILFHRHMQLVTKLLLPQLNHLHPSIWVTKK